MPVHYSKQQQRCDEKIARRTRINQKETDTNKQKVKGVTKPMKISRGKPSFDVKNNTISLTYSKVNLTVHLGSHDFFKDRKFRLLFAKANLMEIENPNYKRITFNGKDDILYHSIFLKLDGSLPTKFRFYIKGNISEFTAINLNCLVEKC